MVLINTRGVSIDKVILERMISHLQKCKAVNLCFVGLFLICAISCSSNDTRSELDRPNIILMIGDGIGLSQVSLLDYSDQVEQNSFRRFEYVGLLNTSSSSHRITDSAVGATAYSCGVRTYNGAIGVSADSTPINSIFQLPELSNWKKGIIATSSIVHATPAAFYSNAVSRSMKTHIASQLKQI